MDKAEIAREFEIDIQELEDVELIYAVYEQEAYEGSAEVIFRKAGQLYTVSGGHCSCYGLEGQWKPVEVTPAALVHLIEKATYGIYRDQAQSIREALGAHGVVEASPAQEESC